MLRSKVRFPAAILSVMLEDPLLCVWEVHLWKDFGCQRYHNLEDLQLLGAVRCEIGEDPPDDVGQKDHDRRMILDEPHLGVHTDVLVEVTDGLMRFGSEDRSHFVHTFKDTNHHLLIKLGALCQVRLLPEVLDREDSSS